MPRRKRSCKWLQKELFSYLKTVIDPYDFADLLPAWAVAEAEAAGTDDIEDFTDMSVDDLSDRRRADFREWLQNSDALQRALRNDPLSLPPYVVLHAEKALPSGSWLVHFTNATPFRAFDRGITLDRLHLSNWVEKKATANCKTNLSDEIGIYETVFGFAYDLADESRRLLAAVGPSRYGRNAVLFQCDCAVKAYHDGDEEDQVVFPICSEYNAIPIFNPTSKAVAVETTDGNEVVFKNFAEVAAYASSSEQRVLAGCCTGPVLRRMR